jgi:hypothetical protein
MSIIAIHCSAVPALVVVIVFDYILVAWRYMAHVLNHAAPYLDHDGVPGCRWALARGFGNRVAASTMN